MINSKLNGMKPKVLMFGWEFPPHIAGGLGTACLGITKGLASNDVDVIFVMPRASGDEDESDLRIISASRVVTNFSEVVTSEYIHNIKTYGVGSNLVPYMDPERFEYEVNRSVKESKEYRNDSVEGTYNFSGSYGSNLMEEVARYAIVAAEIAKDEDFDVIHAHDWLTYAAGIEAKKVSGKPLVVHVHATEYDRSAENKNTLVLSLEKEGMMAADRVVTVSNLTRDIVINKYGINPAKVVTVHNAVDFKGDIKVKANRGLNRKVVTFLGRITFQKGPEYFIEAARKVLDRDPDVHFVMAGNGDLMTSSIRRVAELKMGTNFHFTGFLRGADVQKMFAQSDVYVMPSVSEPFGISPLEAIRAGVPTIISKQSGVAEVIENAIKVDFWDVDALADSIYGLLKYPSLNNMIEKLGYDEVNALRWDEPTKKLKDLYLSIIKGVF